MNTESLHDEILDSRVVLYMAKLDAQEIAIAAVDPRVAVHMHSGLAVDHSNDVGLKKIKALVAVGLDVD